MIVPPPPTDNFSPTAVPPQVSCFIISRKSSILCTFENFDLMHEKKNWKFLFVFFPSWTEWMNEWDFKFFLNKKKAHEHIKILEKTTLFC